MFGGEPAARTIWSLNRWWEAPSSLPCASSSCSFCRCVCSFTLKVYDFCQKRCFFFHSSFPRTQEAWKVRNCAGIICGVTSWQWHLCLSVCLCVRASLGSCFDSFFFSPFWHLTVTCGTNFCSAYCSADPSWPCCLVFIIDKSSGMWFL